MRARCRCQEKGYGVRENSIHGETHRWIGKDSAGHSVGDKDWRFIFSTAGCCDYNNTQCTSFYG